MFQPRSDDTLASWADCAHNDDDDDDDDDDMVKYSFQGNWKGSRRERRRLSCLVNEICSRSA